LYSTIVQCFILCVPCLLTYPEYARPPSPVAFFIGHEVFWPLYVVSPLSSIVHCVWNFSCNN